MSMVPSQIQPQAIVRDRMAQHVGVETLPLHMAEAVSRHVDNLAALVVSLQTGGRGEAEIHALLDQLITLHHADLRQALEDVN